jgi:glycopeptide antibiotics resistance protein
MPSEDVPDIALFEGFDKFVHVCLYLGFAWLLCWSLRVERKPFLYYLILLLSFMWGLLMEIFQFLMHFGRAFEWFDILSNTSGALIGILIYRLMIRTKRDKKHV